MSGTQNGQTPPHAAFGARLKSARNRTGKSQAKIATEVGTSRRHWIRWESGWNLPSTTFMTRIAEATGQPTDALTGARVPAATADEEERDAVEALFAVLRKVVREEMKGVA